MIDEHKITSCKGNDRIASRQPMTTWKFGLATTTAAPTTTTTTVKAVETTVITKNVTEKPDSSVSFCVLPLLAASLLIAF